MVYVVWFQVVVSFFLDETINFQKIASAKTFPKNTESLKQKTSRVGPVKKVKKAYDEQSPEAQEKLKQVLAGQMLIVDDDL